MEDFFAQIEGRWPAGREDLHWHVLPDPVVVRDRLAAQYQQLTHRPGLVPVRPRWAHITIQHYAPAAAISDVELAAVVALVGERCARIGPFAVTVGRAEAWYGGGRRGGGGRGGCWRGGQWACSATADRTRPSHSTAAEPVRHIRRHTAQAHGAGAGRLLRRGCPRGRPYPGRCASNGCGMLNLPSLHAT
jgi:hypothetical protein